MPMQVVTNSSCPSMAKGAHLSADEFAILLERIVSPSDAITVAKAPQAVAQTAGHRGEELVADPVAEGVVDVLEPVEVEEEHGELGISRDVGGLHGTCEADQEVGPVEHPGDRVDTSPAVEARLRADHTYGLPEGVPEGDPAGEHPAEPAIGKLDPVLALEVRGAVLEVGSHGVFQPVPVVGVDESEEVLLGRHDLLGREAAQGLELGAERHRVGHQIPVPEAVGRTGNGRVDRAEVTGGDGELVDRARPRGRGGGLGRRGLGCRGCGHSRWRRRRGGRCRSLDGADPASQQRAQRLAQRTDGRKRTCGRSLLWFGGECLGLGSGLAVRGWAGAERGHLPLDDLAGSEAQTQVQLASAQR